MFLLKICTLLEYSKSDHVFGAIKWYLVVFVTSTAALLLLFFSVIALRILPATGVTTTQICVWLSDHNDVSK